MPISPHKAHICQRHLQEHFTLPHYSRSDHGGVNYTNKLNREVVLDSFTITFSHSLLWLTQRITYFYHYIKNDMYMIQIYPFPLKVTDRCWICCILHYTMCISTTRIEWGFFQWQHRLIFNAVSCILSFKPINTADILFVFFLDRNICLTLYTHY